MLDALAGDEGRPVERDPGEGPAVGVGAADEDLAERRHGHERRRTEHRLVGRHVAPAEHLETLVVEDPLDGLGGDHRHVLVLGEEGDPRGVLPRRRQVERKDVAVEAVGYLDEDAGTVAGVDVGALGAPVLHVAEGADALHDRVVGGATVDVADEADAARIVFVAGVVQALTRWQIASHGVSSGSPTSGRETRCSVELGRRWPGCQNEKSY